MSTINMLPSEIRQMIIGKLSIPDQREAIFSGLCKATGSQQVILGERNRVSVKDLMRIDPQDLGVIYWHRMSSKFQFKRIEVVFSASSIEWIKNATCLPEWVRRDPLRVLEEFLNAGFPIDKIIFDESVKSVSLYNIGGIEEVELLGSDVKLTRQMRVPRVKIPAKSLAEYDNLDCFGDLRVVATDNINPVIGAVSSECVFETTNPRIVFLDYNVDFEPMLAIRIVITESGTSPVISTHRSFTKLVVTFDIQTPESVAPIIYIIDSVDTLVVECSRNISVSVRGNGEFGDMVFTNCTGEVSDDTEVGPDDTYDRYEEEYAYVDYLINQLGMFGDA